jgi:uncharacterized protein (TIGR03085 family)
VSRHAHEERLALASLLEAVGPDHPTLCTGWTSGDLAAHLVLRERRPDAAAGILVPQLAGHTAAVQRQLREQHTYEELVRLFREGPPRWSVFNVPGVDEAANLTEHFVHLEDVRRAAAGWEPRDLSAGMPSQLWERLRRGGRLFFRRVPGGITLRRTDTGDTAVARTGEPHVEISGLPGELMVYAFNRKDQARVDMTGDPDLVAKLSTTRLGL